MLICNNLPEYLETNSNSPTDSQHALPTTEQQMNPFRQNLSMPTCRPVRSIADPAFGYSESHRIFGDECSVNGQVVDVVRRYLQKQLIRRSNEPAIFATCERKFGKRAAFILRLK